MSALFFLLLNTLDLMPDPHIPHNPHRSNTFYLSTIFLTLHKSKPCDFPLFSRRKPFSIRLLIFFKWTPNLIEQTFPSFFSKSLKCSFKNSFSDPSTFLMMSFVLILRSPTSSYQAARKSPNFCRTKSPHSICSLVAHGSLIPSQTKLDLTHSDHCSNRPNGGIFWVVCLRNGKLSEWLKPLLQIKPGFEKYVHANP